MYRGLIDPKTASDVFGRRIAHRYVAVQVTVANRSKEYEFLIHDATLDVGGILGPAEMQKLRTRRDDLLQQSLGSIDQQISDLQKLPKRTQLQQERVNRLEAEEGQIKNQMTEAPLRELSSEELSIVRGVAEVGQSLDPRNLILRLLRGAGTIAGGITGVTTFGVSYAPSVAAFNGPLLTAYLDLFPDLTINQLTRLQDSAYQADSLVPKEQSKVFVVFMPQAIFMNRKQMGMFWKDPALLERQIDFRLLEVTIRGCFITEVQQPPSVSSLSPTSGPAGAPVTITGTAFGNSQGTSTVTFNGAPATSTSWSATNIVAPVPTNATTGQVAVTVGSLASNGLTFAVAPSITSLSSTSGSVGLIVTVTGTAFGTSQGTSTVTFSGVPAAPNKWSSTQIVAPVPAGATQGPVVVTVGGLASSGVMFTVSPTTARP